MIIDRIENSDRYLGLGKKIARTLKYINDTDLTTVKAGKYIIEPDQIIMLINEYEINNSNRQKLEGHRKFIDLQYWVYGTELMGYSPLKDQDILEDYNPDTDCTFYNCQASYTLLEPGMFAIYFPTDLHTAVMPSEKQEKVKKIVFKVAVD